ncbi:FAR1-related sequence 3 [Rhynchospora pubera]|uniref:FAR1-related sequence 3 n=1 Tax=Rhynchospora pubera TaxID=906938 RepID=A0AAV8FQE8_9POAL|nr:FAR1-related sequence 3 [Rhynchospora pubera]
MSINEGDKPPGHGSISKKRYRRKSEVWKHLDVSPDGERAICKYCSKSLCANTDMGTSHLKRHIKVCKRLIEGTTSQTPVTRREEGCLHTTSTPLKSLGKLHSLKENNIGDAAKGKVESANVKNFSKYSDGQQRVDDPIETTNAGEEQQGESNVFIFAEEERKVQDKHADVASLMEYGRIVSMTFSSEHEAFKFFNDYAKRKGFSVRKSIIVKDKANKTITFRRFYCSRHGFREKKHLEKPNRRRRHKLLTRCGCPVKFCVKLDTKTSVWWVHDFIDRHNHDLAAIDTAPFLRSHCFINDAQKLEISTKRASGIRNCQIRDYDARCSGGYQNRGYQEKNLYNLSVADEQSRKLGDDADSVLKYFHDRKKSDPDFFFKYDTKDGCLNRLFWADGQSVVDYAYFGDMVIFDSTYQLNRYNMIVVPFLGCNHHRSTIIFACGIVSRENDETYQWLLEAFLEATFQQHPQSVITDGDLAMGNAIKSILKGATHRICSWHMERNAKKYIHDETVLAKFRELVYRCSLEEFEEKWKDFVKKVSEKLPSRKWLQMIYGLKESWAVAFLNKKMFLGMSSTQRSESFNSDLHNYINGKMSLCMAVKQFERCLTHKRTKEAEFYCIAFQKEPVLQTPFPDLEKSAARSYTPNIFHIVRDEMEMAVGLVVDEILNSSMASKYMVSRKEKAESQYIVHCSRIQDDVDKISCTCAKLECEKIPCRHIFAVLIHMKATCIPRCCICDRWTKHVKSAFPSDREGGTFNVSNHCRRFHELNKAVIPFHYEVAKSPVDYLKLMESIEQQKEQFEHVHDKKFAGSSKVKQDVKEDVKSLPTIGNPKPIVTKGAPKKNKKRYERIKSAIESKRKNKCGRCGQRGHNRQTCQLHRRDAAAASIEELGQEGRDNILGPSSCN